MAERNHFLPRVDAVGEGGISLTWCSQEDLARRMVKITLIPNQPLQYYWGPFYKSHKTFTLTDPNRLLHMLSCFDLYLDGKAEVIHND